MAKKAYLAEFCIMTRIVVDIPDNISEEEEDEYINEHWGEFSTLAANNVKDDPDGYLHGDNLVSVVSDDECPYGSID